MYSGVLIHATWTVSSEGLGLGTGLAEGVPVEEVSQSSSCCTWASTWLMKTQPFIIIVLWIIGLGTPVRGPGYPQGKRGYNFFLLGFLYL